MDVVLETYVSIADAIALLLRPHAEVVIHDLRTGRIAHVANNFSRRRVGDESLTEIDGTMSLDGRILGPYRKVNWDGRELRSITVVLRDERQAAVGLLCVNFDVSKVQRAVEALASLMRLPDPDAAPAALFASDWREAINGIISQYLADRGQAIDGLDHRMVGELVRHLDREGYFAIRNAANHIGQVLGLSRATIYKHLKTTRQENIRDKTMITSKTIFRPYNSNEPNNQRARRLICSCSYEPL